MQLRNEGLYVTHARELFGEAEFADLMLQTFEWMSSPHVADECRKFAAGTRQAGLKAFVIKYNESRIYDRRDALILIACAPIVRQIVQEAIGPAKLLCVDLWHNPPGCNQKEKVWSQSWHRDPEDRNVVKVFLYLSDVDEDSGPFEYVKTSHQKFGDIWPFHVSYQRNADLSCIDPALFTKNTGKAGTVIFAQTSGLHQGGHGSKARTMAVFTWVPEDSPARMLWGVK